MDRARALVDDHVRVEVLGWERSGRYPRELAAASGLTALFVPEPAGGLGLSYPDGMRVFEQLGRGDAAFAFSLSMHNAVAAALHGAGSPELIATWGERLRTGNALGGFSLTEPQAGSDATAITTVADRDGQGWRVSGRKAWVSLAGEADLFLVVCHTGDGCRPPRHRDHGGRRAGARRLVPVHLRQGRLGVPADRRDAAGGRTCAGTGAGRDGPAGGTGRDRRGPLRHRRDRDRPARGVARRGPALRPRPAGIRRTGARLPGHPLDAGRRRHRAGGVTPAGCCGSGTAGHA